MFSVFSIKPLCAQSFTRTLFVFNSKLEEYINLYSSKGDNSPSIEQNPMIV